MGENVKHVTPEKFDSKRRTKLCLIFAVALAIVIIAQYWVHPYPYFKWDGHFLFYPVFGFGCAVLLVFITKILGFFLKRRENYWEDNA